MLGVYLLLGLGIILGCIKYLSIIQKKSWLFSLIYWFSMIFITLASARFCYLVVNMSNDVANQATIMYSIGMIIFFIIGFFLKKFLDKNNLF